MKSQLHPTLVFFIFQKKNPIHMKTFLSVCLFIFLCGCSNLEQSSASQADGFEIEANKVAEPPPPPAAPLQVKQSAEAMPNVVPRHIIKNADLRLQVKNVDKSTSSISELTERFNGFIAGMELTNDNYEISNKIKVRIPAGNFEPYMNALAKEAVFTYHKNVNTQDVTAEYVDLQSRLKTKKEVKENVILPFCGARPRPWEDVLHAEEMIRKLQEEIESTEGRLRYLSNQTSLSTILVDIYEPKEYAHEPVVLHGVFLAEIMGRV